MSLWTRAALKAMIMACSAALWTGQLLPFVCTVLCTSHGAQGCGHAAHVAACAPGTCTMLADSQACCSVTLERLTLDRDTLQTCLERPHLAQLQDLKACSRLASDKPKHGLASPSHTPGCALVSRVAGLSVKDEQNANPAALRLLPHATQGWPPRQVSHTWACPSTSLPNPRLCTCAGGDVRGLDFRWFVGGKKIGAPFHGLKAFFTTPQLALFDKVQPPLAAAGFMQPSHVPTIRSCLALLAAGLGRGDPV